MSVDTVASSLAFMEKHKVKTCMVSGGEPTLSPEFEQIMDMVCMSVPFVILMSNGTFAFDDHIFNIVKDILDRWTTLSLQVRTHPRYYPSYKRIMDCRRLRKLPRTFVQDDGIVLTALGRCTENQKKFPTCSNFWSASQNKGLSFSDVIREIESRGRFCTPSINVDGTISMGETPFCQKIGNVVNGVGKVLGMKPCNKCGLGSALEEKLTELRKARATCTSR